MFYTRTKEGLSNVFDQIATELRHQYLIGYYPTNLRRDGKWHRVKVNVKQIGVANPASPNKSVILKELNVRARTGYYARF